MESLDPGYRGIVAGRDLVTLCKARPGELLLPGLSPLAPRPATLPTVDYQ